MLKLKEKAFMDAITPVILKLDYQWFQPTDAPNEKGQYRGCAYCDLECGGTERHDADCIVQAAHDTVAEWNWIEKSDRWSTCRVTDEPNTPEFIADGKQWDKYHAVLKTYLKQGDFIPLDYNDPDTKGTCCVCFIWAEKAPPLACEPDCPIMLTARALSALYAV